MLLKKDEVSTNNLMSHLRKINAHLERNHQRFLTGDTMCCFDCELMPRLQHIRVAGKYFLDFDIPVEMAALWRYMYHMYQLDAFTQSCPADQDIINHYKLQQVGVSSNTTNILHFRLPCCTLVHPLYQNSYSPIIKPKLL